MKARRRESSDDRLTTVQTKSTEDGRENSEALPVGLISEILLKLPAKSIARCRCVSKPWASMLRSPDFTELFLTRSYARPRLLFCQIHGNEVLFLTSLQPQDLDENSSSLAVSYQMKFAFDMYDIFRPVTPVNGFVFVKDEEVIFNPSTGDSFTLPEMKTTDSTFFVYDPIGEQYKVLSVPQSSRDDHQVLTLGTGESSWRMIECKLRHYPLCVGTCINGVLYYVASVDSLSTTTKHMIVCFDVRTEKFSYIELMRDPEMCIGASLLKCNGKLASLTSKGNSYITGTCQSFEMRVLEDPEKHEWSKHVYELPPLWQHLVGESILHFVGLTGTNEVVLSPRFPSHPFYVIYYNLERKTIRRVEIQGMGELNGSTKVFLFLDYVENLKTFRTL